MRRTLSGYLSSGALRLTQAMITAENVNILFEQTGFSGEVDILSINVACNDYWVWKAIEVVKPRLVVIEYNATLRPPLLLVVPYQPTAQWDGTNYFGASLEALLKLGRTKGYRIVGCKFSGSNACFVRDDLCEDHFVEPATAEEHYEPPRFISRRSMSAIPARSVPTSRCRELYRSSQLLTDPPTSDRASR
jgi:hypothetical protein